jgi:DNA-binding MarR family transcriptional regulator
MLLVNRSNVTGLVDRMEQAGWVERVPDPEDRRVKRIQMTKPGREILAKAERKYYQRMREVMGVLSREESRQLCAMLERVRERLRGGDGSTG